MTTKEQLADAIAKLEQLGRELSAAMATANSILEAAQANCPHPTSDMQPRLESAQPSGGCYCGVCGTKFAARPAMPGPSIQWLVTRPLTIQFSVAWDVMSGLNHLFQTVSHTKPVLETFIRRLEKEGK